MVIFRTIRKRKSTNSAAKRFQRGGSRTSSHRGGAAGPAAAWRFSWNPKRLMPRLLSSGNCLCCCCCCCCCWWTEKVDLGVQIVWHSSCRWRNYNMMMASFYSFYYCPGQHYWFPGINGHVKTMCLNTIFLHWSYYENGSSNLTKHFVHLCNWQLYFFFVIYVRVLLLAHIFLPSSQRKYFFK